MANQTDNFQRKHNNPLVDAIPEVIPTQSALEEFDEVSAQELAKSVSEVVSDERIKNENTYDMKKLERMARGFSEEQQRVIARTFNHYILLDALRYQFNYFDEYEKATNEAFARLNHAREEVNHE